MADGLRYKRRMDIRQLRMLVAVAEHRSFSGAARAMNTVQSNVSTQVAKLEAELNAALIDRSTNQLTIEGQMVVRRAQRIASEMDHITADVARLAATVVGTVHVGVIGTTARWLVPRLLDLASQRYPEIGLVFVDGTSTLLVPQVVASRLDIAVLNLSGTDRAVAIEPLFAEPRVAVVPDDHTLADRDTIELIDLVDVPLLMEVKGSPMRAHLDAFASSHGVNFSARAEIDGLRLIASLAFAGFGVAILPASAAPNWIGGNWTSITVTDAPSRQVGIARRRPGILSTAAQAVEALIYDVVADASGRPEGIVPIGGTSASSTTMAT